MADSSPARLGSAHLDDLAIVILTTPPGAVPATSHPELNDEERARLRARLKLIGRHNWPANMGEDPLIRRGYTLRQCFRLMAALLLLDAHVPPSLAVPIARSNELLFLRMIASRLAVSEGAPTQSDPIAVVTPGELWERLDPDGAHAAEPYRIRALPRSELGNLWSDAHDLGTAGQRLVIDIGGAAATLWRWMRIRDLMPVNALADLMTDVEQHADVPGYLALEARSKRR